MLLPKEEFGIVVREEIPGLTWWVRIEGEEEERCFYPAHMLPLLELEPAYGTLPVGEAIEDHLAELAELFASPAFSKKRSYPGQNGGDVL